MLLINLFLFIWCNNKLLYCLSYLKIQPTLKKHPYYRQKLQLQKCSLFLRNNNALAELTRNSFKGEGRTYLSKVSSSFFPTQQQLFFLLCLSFQIHLGLGCHYKNRNKLHFKKYTFLSAIQKILLLWKLFLDTCFRQETTTQKSL